MLVIEALLKKYGIKQSHIARVTGMDPATVSRLSHGVCKPHPNQAARIASAINWRLDPALLFIDADGLDESLEDTDSLTVGFNIVGKDSIDSEAVKIMTGLADVRNTMDSVVLALDLLISDLDRIKVEVAPC